MAVGVPVQLTNGSQNSTALTTFSTATVLVEAGSWLEIGIYFRDKTGTDDPTVVWNGITLTRIGDAQVLSGGREWRVFGGINTGVEATAAVVVTRQSTDTWGRSGWSVRKAAGVNTSAPVVAANTVGGKDDSFSSATQTLTYAQAMGSDGALMSSWCQPDANSASATPRSGWTESADVTSAGVVTLESQYRLTTDTAAAVTWLSAQRTMGIAYELAPAAAPAGPTITVQPVADTVILSNETTASFSVTATGTGSLSYDWELENGVGSGVYANLANGNGATWTGQAAASCTATLTTKALSGRRVRCNVTDSNGTTTTNAVALTIWDGPQVTTFPATNGSGVSTATLTSDYVTGVGEAIEVRIPLSDGDVAVTVTTT